MTHWHHRKVGIVCCILAGALCLGTTSLYGQSTSFHIGNSLTRDSQPEAIPAFAAMRGQEHSTGFHARGASSLTKIWDLPFDDNVAVDPVYGNFTTALPDYKWDAVTLQPYNGHRLDQEVDSALEYINLTRSKPENADTVFYVYESWPDRNGGTYQEKWTAPIQSLTNPFATRTRAFFDMFYERLSSETDATIRTIPVGEVLYQFDLAAEQGEIPGFDSVAELYRDFVHLKVEVGRYIASATTFATLLDESPIGLTKPDGFFLSESFPLSSGFYSAVNSIIRDVLNSDPHTGVFFPYSDFDNDGAVDAYDLALWEDSYPGPQYDVVRDGRVDGLDFLHWQRRYNTQPQEFDESSANLDGLGLVDDADMRLWEQAYQIDDGGDVDGDGDTDGLDFLALQRAYTPFDPADVNRDRRVDGGDLESWEASYGYGGLVDFDEDGAATGMDFLLWQREAAIGSSSTVVETVQVIPEPGTLASCLSLLGFYSLSLAGRPKTKMLDSSRRMVPRQ